MSEADKMFENLGYKKKEEKKLYKIQQFWESTVLEK
jgi:hypothetical protein